MSNENIHYEFIKTVNINVINRNGIFIVQHWSTAL